MRFFIFLTIRLDSASSTTSQVRSWEEGRRPGLGRGPSRARARGLGLYWSLEQACMCVSGGGLTSGWHGPHGPASASVPGPARAQAEAARVRLQPPVLLQSVWVRAWHLRAQCAGSPLSAMCRQHLRAPGPPSPLALPGSPAMTEETSFRCPRWWELLLCVQGNCFHVDAGLPGHIMALAPDGWFQALAPPCPSCRTWGSLANLSKFLVPHL